MRPLLCCLFFAFGTLSARAATLPNILFILADDLGWGDVGYHGSKIETPHLDRLVKEGVELDQHYVYPVCTPTRVALLTGHYPSRYGNIQFENERVLPWRARTLATALKSVGYRTHLAGKWHLGSLPEWRPNLWGFDHTYGLLAGGAGYFEHLYKRKPYRKTWHRDGRLFEEEGHTTDLLAREVIRWIERERDSPWFIYVPFTAVHAPIQPKQEWIDHYKDKFPKFEDRLYPALATHMDDAIGKIVEAVKKRGQWERTITVFASDNGAVPLSNVNRAYPGEQWACQGGNNAPLRGKKGTLYEGGIRTPAFVIWPDKLQPRKVTTPIHITDWMPTFCALAGLDPPGNLEWDGKDVWSALRGERTGLAERTLYWKWTHGEAALRHGDHKLVVDGSGDAELFNVAEDPHEEKDVAGTQPEVAEELRALLREVAKGDDRWLPDADAKP